MTTNPMIRNQGATDQQSVSGLAQLARVVYLVLAVLFAGGVILQVFFAGAALLVHADYLPQHRDLGDALARIPVFMVVISLFARLPTRLILLGILLFGLYILQYIFLYAVPAMGLPAAFRALHAVNALAIFGIALRIVKAARRLPNLSPRVDESQTIEKGVRP